MKRLIVVNTNDNDMSTILMNDDSDWVSWFSFSIMMLRGPDNDHHGDNDAGDGDDDDVAGVSQKERYMGQVKGAIRAKRWLKVMMILQ